MTDTRYGKPCLTNLPSDLFKDIATEMLHSPKPDYSEMRNQCDFIRKQILTERSRECEKP